MPVSPYPGPYDPKPPLLKLGEFTLHSGEKSHLKIFEEGLCDESIAAVAHELANLVGPFFDVEGIPEGGLRIKKAMDPYVVQESRYYLIVDDVYTSGYSMEEARIDVARDVGVPFLDIKGAVIFARRPLPSWITPLFSRTTK